MAEELDILKIVAENPSISQRKIAEQTNISLGQVNFLIKKCVKKGFVKIEGQTTKSIKYNLTPRGFAEKARLTLDYIKISYKAVSSLTDKISELCKEYEKKGTKIYVYGSNDEMMQIIKLVMESNHILWSQWSGEEIIKKESSSEEYVVFYWEVGLKEELIERQIKAINVLE
jgi:DNA-binding MarR family transcriptional regulator